MQTTLSIKTGTCPPFTFPFLKRTKMSLHFTFQENPLLKFLQCPQCSNVLSQPTRLHTCGHTFCEPCAPDLLGQCPSCLTTVEAKQPDLIAVALISDLQVRCSAPECPFSGSFEQFMANHCGNCPIQNSGSLQGWMDSLYQTLQKNRSKGPKSPIQLDGSPDTITIQDPKEETLEPNREQKEKEGELVVVDEEEGTFQQMREQAFIPEDQKSEIQIIECIPIKDSPTHQGQGKKDPPKIIVLEWSK